MLYLLPSIVVLAVIIFALADVITGDGRIKHLDKMTWILIILFLPLIGSILWFAVGREYAPRAADLGGFGDPRRHQEPAPSTTEQELVAIEREIAAHEKQARIDRLEAELRLRREAQGEA